METQKEIQAEVQPKQKAKPKQKKAVDQKTYDAFIDLHFMILDGAILKDSVEKEYKALEKEIKSCEGKKPKVTRTCSFSTQIIKLAKDIPVPSEVYEYIKGDTKNLSFYF